VCAAATPRNASASSVSGVLRNFFMHASFAMTDTIQCDIVRFAPELHFEVRLLDTRDTSSNATDARAFRGGAT
jgi:hypothetical protein